MMYDLYRVCHLEFSCLLPLYLLPCAFSPRCSGSSVGSPSRHSSFRRSAFELTSLHPFFYTRPRARRAGMAAGRKAPSPAPAPAVADLLSAPSSVPCALTLRQHRALSSCYSHRRLPTPSRFPRRPGWSTTRSRRSRPRRTRRSSWMATASGPRRLLLMFLLLVEGGVSWGHLMGLVAGWRFQAISGPTGSTQAPPKPRELPRSPQNFFRSSL